MKRIDLNISSVSYIFIVVSHKVFMKKQPFLDFLCEVMRESPGIKRRHRQNENNRNIDINDILHLFDQNTNIQHYRDEIEYLLNQCKSKRLYFLLDWIICVHLKIFLCVDKWQIKQLNM